MAKPSKRTHVEKSKASPPSQPALRVVTPPSKIEIVARVREAYIRAPLGAHPNITKILHDLNLLDASDPSTVTTLETEIRDIAAKENWKWERQMFLSQSIDLLPQELQLAAIQRGVELQKMLDRAINMNFRALTQLHQEGRATAITTGAEIPHPDAKTLAALILTRQRVAETLSDDLERCASMFNSVESKLSPLAVRHMVHIQNMTGDELRSEIQRLEIEAKLIEGQAFEDEIRKQFLEEGKPDPFSDAEKEQNYGMIAAAIKKAAFAAFLDGKSLREIATQPGMPSRRTLEIWCSREGWVSERHGAWATARRNAIDERMPAFVNEHGSLESAQYEMAMKAVAQLSALIEGGLTQHQLSMPQTKLADLVARLIKKCK